MWPYPPTAEAHSIISRPQTLPGKTLHSPLSGGPKPRVFNTPDIDVRSNISDNESSFLNHMIKNSNRDRDVSQIQNSAYSFEKMVLTNVETPTVYSHYHIASLKITGANSLSELLKNQMKSKTKEHPSTPQPLNSSTPQPLNSSTLPYSKSQCNCKPSRGYKRNTKCSKHNPSAIVKRNAILSISKNGCRCKKIRCLKKYCECYAGGQRCSKNCLCDDCQNGKD